MARWTRRAREALRTDAGRRIVALLVVATIASFAATASAAATPGSAAQSPPPAEEKPALEAPPDGEPPPIIGSSQASPRRTPVTFVIEKLTVSGVRHGSEKIVASESLLTAGTAYTERQLREALHRIERLPFVVKADFALRRGSQRGRFELVITVTESKPVFLGGTLLLGASTRNDPLSGWMGRATPEIGARVFFKGQNEVSVTTGGYGSAGRDIAAGWSGAVDVAYRHHDLFGRHIVGTVVVGRPYSGTRKAGVEIGLPLGAASMVALGVEQQRRDFVSETWADQRFTGHDRSTTTSTGLSWRRDTTDDPFAPRQGSRVEANGSLLRTESHGLSSWDRWQGSFPTWLPDAAPIERWTAQGDDDGLAGSLAVRRYWPVSNALSFGLVASANGYRSRFEGTTAKNDVLAHADSSERWSRGAGLDAELLGVISQKKCWTGQCWWSLRASLRGHRSHESWSPPRGWLSSPAANSGADTRYTSFGLTAEIAARGRWGTARLQLAYYYDRSRYELLQ